MQSFTCPTSGDRVYFDNLACGCGAPLYYEPEARAMWNEATPCANRDVIGCNWAVAPGETLCRACLMTDIVPDFSVGNNQELFARAERAKRWVLANISNWGWFTDADQGPRPSFQMLSEHIAGSEEQIMMGYADGIITINVTEADELIRLQRQQQLREQYRSMVGHFRHEIAHFLFNRLSIAPGFLDAFRTVFGDERADYGAALQEHYANPKLPNGEYITEYATAHPHEDWAETTAHLLHMVDFTDSFVSAGLSMAGVPENYAPYQDSNAQHLLTITTDVAIAMNDINRALDNSDLYPFVLTPRIREKLSFVHDWVMNHAARGA